MRMVNTPSKSFHQTQYLPLANGMQLVVETRGPETGPSVLFAHGLGQTRHAWDAAAQTFAEHGYRAITYDARGHGESSRSAGGDYTVQQFCDDLARLAQAQPDPPVLVGASMGGLIGLVVAAEHSPLPFRALVLVDITPQWEPTGVDRVFGFMRARPDGFANIQEAVAAVADYLPGRAQPKTADDLAALLYRRANGRWYWHWDPAMLESIAAEGERHHARLERAARALRIPTLLLSGAASDVISPATIDQFLRWAPHAEHIEIPGATHMLVGDANTVFARETLRFIDRICTASETGTAG